MYFVNIGVKGLKSSKGARSMGWGWNSRMSPALKPWLASVVYAPFRSLFPGSLTFPRNVWSQVTLERGRKGSLLYRILDLTPGFFFNFSRKMSARRRFVTWARSLLMHLTSIRDLNQKRWVSSIWYHQATILTKMCGHFPLYARSLKYSLHAILEIFASTLRVSFLFPPEWQEIYPKTPSSEPTIMVKSSWDDPAWMWNYELLLYLEAIINIVGSYHPPLPPKSWCEFVAVTYCVQGGIWYRPNTFDHDCSSWSIVWPVSYSSL